MQTKVKIDIRSLLINGAMSQLLHVKIVVIIFVILMFLLRQCMLSANYILPVVLKSQAQYIRDILQFFQYGSSPKLKKKL